MDSFQATQGGGSALGQNAIPVALAACLVTLLSGCHHMQYVKRTGSLDVMPDPLAIKSALLAHDAISEVAYSRSSKGGRIQHRFMFDGLSGTILFLEEADGSAEFSQRHAIMTPINDPAHPLVVGGASDMKDVELHLAEKLKLDAMTASVRQHSKPARLDD